MTKLKPNKLLGQNFLRDRSALAKIIKTADLKAGERVLEVGPGLGALTEELAKHAGRVVAVEKDKNLAKLLQEKFAAAPNVKIVSDDILKILDLGIDHLFKNLKLKIKNYKVVANIPYYLTSHLIRLLLELPNPPQDIVLLVQREVAQRICAQPPKMSLLAISVQFYAQPQIIAKVPKGAFWPQPKVDSAIIKITPQSKRAKIDAKQFFKVAKAGFSQPRKQLLNNLSAGLKIPRPQIADFLAQAGLNPQQRAGTLTLDDWLKLTKLIFK